MGKTFHYYSELWDENKYVQTSGWSGNNWADVGTGEKSGIHLLRQDEQQLGRELDGVSRDRKRWKQRPRSGRGREVAVGNEIHSGFQFSSRPIPDTTTFSRPDHYRAYSWFCFCLPSRVGHLHNILYTYVPEYIIHYTQ